MKQKKKKVSLTDAKQMIKELLRMRESGTPQQKKEFLEAVERGYEKSGKELVQRAIDDKIITKKQYEQWQKKYELEYKDAGVFLLAYFARMDGATPKEEEVLIVTLPRSSLWQMKKILKKRFGLVVKSPAQTNQIMKKIKQKELAKQKNQEKPTYIG